MVNFTSGIIKVYSQVYPSRKYSAEVTQFLNDFLNHIYAQLKLNKLSILNLSPELKTYFHREGLRAQEYFTKNGKLITVNALIPDDKTPEEVYFYAGLEYLCAELVELCDENPPSLIGIKKVFVVDQEFRELRKNLTNTGFVF